MLKKLVNPINFLMTVLLLLPHQLLANDGTAEQRIAQSLAKIRALDSTYKAVISLNPTAIDEAKKLDAEPFGVLNGLPILVKDNIEVAGLPTTAGSLVLANNDTNRDAVLISQIKQEGGIIIGKANLSEWANFRSEKSSSGWSAVGGQTANAYDVKRSPCGSSSGSAVAVALGYVDVAIGTETHGSIVCPAATNGVVGIKPTHGIVASEGIVPIATSQDTAGPIADTVENAALVLSTMIQPNADNHDNLVLGLRALEEGKPLKTLRIGVLASTLGYDPRRDRLLNLALEKLQAAGVVIVNDITLDIYDGFWDENYKLLKYEFKRDLNSYLAGLPNELNALTLEKIIEFNKINADQELTYFDQGIFEASQAIALTEREYQKILKRNRLATRENGLDDAFSNNDLDAIIGITGSPAWLIDYVNGDAFFGPGMSGFPAIGGNPHITVPGGEIAGLPVGLSFIGERYQDHVLAQLVHKFMSL